jgi:hypothetical protein
MTGTYMDPSKRLQKRAFQVLYKLATNSIRAVRALATPNDLCCKQRSFVCSGRFEPDSNFAAGRQRPLDGQLRPKHRHIQDAQRNIVADAISVSDADGFGGPIRLPARGNATIAS